MSAGSVGDVHKIVVAGDVTIDWHLARVEASPEPITQVSCRTGGAALLGELTEEIAVDLHKNNGTSIEVSVPETPQGVSPTDERFHHLHAIWKFDRNSGGDPAWRVDEFLGLDCSRSFKAEATPTEGGVRGTKLVVLHDAGLGFRDRPEGWLQSVSDLSAERPWILLRMAKPVAQGELWERLQEYADRLIVVVHIDDLRLGEVDISRELSWERTAQDLLWELMYNPRVNGLAQCAYVVVSFTTAGALLFSNKAGSLESQNQLIFDPRMMERMWNDKHPGGMIGGLSSLVASIARQIVLDSENPDITLAVHRGIEAMRNLDLKGYAEDKGPDGRTRLVFPARRLVQELSKDDRPFAEAPVPEPSRRRESGGELSTGRTWTILEERYGELAMLAERIVLRGPEQELENVPIGQFGSFFTVDRNEIEGYRSVSGLIREYNQQENWRRPLSIAVFGPPGSGKSFGVRQVAKSVVPGRVKEVTFNLSQYDNPNMLTDALYRVRDISLAGHLPLVFWDEFDSALLASSGIAEPLGWLRYFLSPMQDGEFQDGQLAHPIGQAVFVFAGGGYSSMQEFMHESMRSHRDERRATKIKDFISRIKGYVNVLGPNPIAEDARNDPGYLIRRALLLRSLLSEAAPRIFHSQGRAGDIDIDIGVLRALLHTKIYRHGIRSMESVIAMSTLAGKHRFERSALPPEAQLDLHVEADDFLELVHRP